MKLTGTDLPPALVTAVRSGFDAFVQLQRVRFGNSTGESVQPAVEGAVARWGATAVVGVANAPANHTNNMNNNSNINNTKNNTNNNAFTMFPSTLCEWSDLVLSRLKAMKESVVLDPTAEVVWELVSTVIAILETGGAEGVNASAPYLEWYRSRFVNVDSIYQVRDTLSAVYSKDSLTQAEETDLFEGVVGPYMISIQRAFLAGLFPVAAELISSLVDYLRSCAVVPFDAEEEGILTDVIRLLLEPPTNSVEHREWMSTANGLIIDAKRILTESRDDSNMIMQVARQLKSLCLDLLLMMSGDAALILDVCHLLELDVMDYIAAICAVCEPYMNLHQLHHLYKSALDSWKGTVCGPWYVGVIESLLGSRSVVDIVTAMHLVGQAVRCNAYMSGWKNHDDNDDNNNNNVVSSPTNPHIVGDLNDTYNTYDDNTSNDTNEGNLNDSSNSSYNSRSGSSSSSNSSSSSSDNNNNNNMNGKSTSVCSSTEETEGHSTLYRRFALLFMAAHVADICAPPLGAAVTHMSITFHRNELVEDFVALFSRHPLLWRTAAMYVMYSPFMNPAILSHIVRRRAATAVKDRYTCLALHTFIHSTWDENSPFQLALRQILRDKYPLSQTVDKWITAVDFYRRKTVEALNADIIKERLLCANTAPAMWLALECQQSKSLQLHFEKILRSPLALQSEEVYRVGQAVNNSFISVDASANLRMLHVLRLCAALCEYRRSLELLQQYDENNKNKNNNNNNNNNVEVSDIQLLQVTLRAAEKALLYVVDFRMHPVAVLTLVEQTAAVAHRLSHSQRPYTLLPLLIHALELAMTSNPTEQSEQRVRAAGIREKIMKLL
ncbi:uncharacterized protein TM35_000045000 [Trypanosoma theileri]|uniref:Nuclear pore complex protein Nup85 n=1 Tax=Trypanosoma theileri TaxID=67003 RepID=A0A1X0P5R9_9TRYP|nr:uncharacterized protein TM35_000045000 [Trypanosoma theileri]ORC92286.1 hypothetical protein TM35_000045000 [Trypanosoma theileri]